MILLSKLYLIYNTYLRQQRNTTLTTEEFANLLDSEQLNYYSELIPLQRTQPEIGQTLDNFRTSKTIPNILNNVYTYPDINTYVLKGCGIIDNDTYSRLEVVSENEYLYRITDAYKPISKYPFAIEKTDITTTNNISRNTKYLQIYTDKSNYNLYFVSLNRPPAPIIVTTEDPDDPTNIIINDSNSQQLLWNDTYIIKILFRLLSRSGIIYNDNELLAMTKV